MTDERPDESAEQQRGAGEPGGEAPDLTPPEFPHAGERPRERSAANARAMRNMQTLAGIVFLALIATLAVVLLSGGKDEPAVVQPTAAQSERPGGPQIAGVEQTTELLEGIPQQDAVLGSPQAPVTILEIADLQCPFCALHQTQVQPEIIERLVRTGKARLQLVSIGMLGEDSERLRNVHERLSAKGKGWEFATLALLNQGRENSGYADDEYLRRIVAAIPGTTPADASAEAETLVRRRVKATRALVKAVIAKLDDPDSFGTPAFAIGPSSAKPEEFEPLELRGDESVAAQLIEAVERRTAGRGTA